MSDVHTAQLLALGAAVKALIRTHPDSAAFVAAYLEIAAQVQADPAIAGAPEAGRDLVRKNLAAYLDEALPPRTPPG